LSTQGKPEGKQAAADPKEEPTSNIADNNTIFLEEAEENQEKSKEQ
jgi:hypothetical protein